MARGPPGGRGADSVIDKSPFYPAIWRFDYLESSAGQWARWRLKAK